jgi:hypothetical protein
MVGYGTDRLGLHERGKRMDPAQLAPTVAEALPEVLTGDLR